MSDITPIYKTISELLSNQTFSIDDYQREYKWDEKNIQELLRDLQGKFESSYREGDQTSEVPKYDSYYLGSIILSNQGEKKYLVDGQQRMTSLTLLLIALMHKTQVQHTRVAQRISSLVFWDDNGIDRFKLDIPERLEVINALFNGQDFNPDGKDESIRNIYARYGQIEQDELWEELGPALPHFAYWLMGRVGLIEIQTGDDAKAYAVFETVNDRGKPLSPVDMLKSYLLGKINDEDRRRQANKVWREEIEKLSSKDEPDLDVQAIKAWLRAQYAQTIRERKAGAKDGDWELIGGSTFHRWVKEHERDLGLETAQGAERFMLHLMPFFMKAYRLILGARKEYTPGLEAVFYNAHNDFTWQSTVLLSPLTLSDDDETVRRKIEVTARYLDIWIMRRVVNYIRVSYSSVSYAMFLLTKDIRHKSLPELVEVLTAKLAEDGQDINFAGSPSRGREGLKALGLNQFSKRYIFHLLARVSEEVERSSGRNERFDQFVARKKNGYDIEHIWSSKLFEPGGEFADEQEFQEWRNRAGSLLLLPADVNRSLQDKPYEYKRGKYAAQNFYAASLHEAPYTNQPQFRNFRESLPVPDLFEPLPQFGKAEQQMRSELLLHLAERIWSPSQIERAAQG
ncbi:DUF262 domain-containing protein [Deinococcus radiophilus]|uniref:DUF262 domain-containing protein n=1 Tax=Deinococcus radiophilus TaxID=32062 RepID=A0A3S0IKW7_9DEIO|nr:DUF262 domain-containing protein [Deinococcus radiophilus]RTR26359.1 DUF262 domain-containing protein [Deinococcus radiophilus]UFA51992.1 DUF262 domain-containing HNH endonuclease family protein [Deinococcus radiophilus]